MPASVYGSVCVHESFQHRFDTSVQAAAAATAKEQVNYLALPTPVRYEELTREAYSTHEQERLAIVTHTPQRR